MNPLNCTCGCSLSLKNFLKTKVVEQLFGINYVKIKIKWLCNVQHREDYIGHYTISMISFCEPVDIMECKYMVVKLILEVQINYCFSL